MAKVRAEAGPGGKDLWSVGCQVSLSTTLGDDVVEGEVFAYEDKTKTLVLRTPVSGTGAGHLGDKEGYDVKILNANFIKQVIKAEPAAAMAAAAKSKPLPYVCTKRAEQREAKALQGARKRAEQIGVGVTRQAQAVFDSINKTLPCKWKERDIVVIGEVTIAAPYAADNCTVVPGAEKTLEQVLKVLRDL